ncbi:hypothetical protein DYB31_004789 [Aphanomyces astaci]|uniref:Cilia- and flagella-associated protein 43 n=1 Tax=Aphanomyces astaci TaxID=112090 RepID=A0A397FD45_APHAT|nr:hypothetical protein DYB31_004789 [Aphanomyces astaci]
MKWRHTPNSRDPITRKIDEMAAPMVDAVPKHAFAYDGGTIILTDEHTTLSKCGNLLKFSSIVSNSQHFLTRSKPTRITAFDANTRASHLALAACEEHAEVSIYSVPEKKLRGKLKIGTSLVFEHYLVKFSRCGSRLLSVGTTPTTNEVPLFDFIDGCDVDLPTRVAFASFNPLDAQCFVTASTDGGVTFWRVCHGVHGRSCFSRVDGTTTDPMLSSSAPETPQLGTSSSGRALPPTPSSSDLFKPDVAGTADDSTCCRYVGHCWSKTPGHVYLVNQRSELVTMDSTTGAVVSRMLLLSSPPVAATALVLTSESLVVGFSDGTIRWLASDDLSLVLQTTTLPHPITTLALSPTCVVLVAGTAHGGQFELKAYVDSFDDDGTAANGPEKQQQSTIPATSLGISHTGAIVAVTTLLPAGGTTNDAALVSGGTSGLLHVWTVVGCRGVAAVDLADLFDPSATSGASSMFASSPFPRSGTDGSGGVTSVGGGRVPIVSLAARYLDPIVLVGDAVGRLRIVGLSKSAAPSPSSTVDLSPLHTVRLFSAAAPIDLLELHPSLPLVLAASSVASAVFVVSLEPDKQFRVLAFVHTSSPPQLVKWVPTSSLESTYFVLTTTAAASGDGSGIGYVLVPNNLDDRMATELPVAPLGASPHLPLECHGGAFLLTPGKLLAYFNRGDKGLHLVKVYDAPGAPKDRELKTLVPLAHAKPITAVARSILSSKEGHEIVATGGADGVVTIWLVQTKRSSSAVFLKDVEIDVRKQKSMVVHAGAVTALVFAMCDDALYVYSTGTDGAVFCLDVHVTDVVSLVLVKSVAEGASPLYAAVVGKDKQPRGTAADKKQPLLVLTEDPKPFLDTYAEEQAALVRAKFEAVKDTIRGPLAEIQLKLKTMLQHNADLPEAEALDRHEFVVNERQEADVLAQSDTRAKEVRRNISRQIAELNIVRDRMRVEFWDSGDVHGVQLHGLNSSLHVVNLPMRKLSKADVRRFEMILRLREIEFHSAVAEPTGTKQYSLHRRKSCMYHHGEIIPPNITWMVNAGLLHPSLKKLGGDSGGGAAGGGAEKGGAAGAGAKTTTPASSKESAGASADDGQTTSASPRLVDLIYHPAMIRTRKQQRTQIHLLQAYERHLVTAYNGEFDALVKLKEAKIDEIEGKNGRMREICAELGVDAAAVTVVYRWHPDEVADSMMRLLPGEATKVPYETDERRKVREAAEAAARLQEEKNKKDDVAGRALNDMMNGTLETKKEAIAAQTVAREAWMDEVAAEDMTAEQKQKVAAFEADAVKLVDDKEKARKALDLELKKLKVDVGDICKAFDDKLKGLHDLYLATRMSVLTQQMYVLRLGEVLMDHEHCCHEKELLQREIDHITADIHSLQADAAQFTAQMEACRDAWQHAVDEDKACEKAFLKEIEDAAGGTPLEHDVMKALVELYRKRRPQGDEDDSSRPGKGGGRKEGGGSMRALSISSNVGDGGNLDPFGHADRRKAPSTKGGFEVKRLLPLDPDVDRPESIATDSAVWSVLNECRVKKMTLEHVVKLKNDLYVEAKGVADATQAKVAALEDKADRYARALHELVDTMDLNSENHPVLVQIKQGQDEASGGDDLVTLFEETESALLISRRSVEALNATILVHGTDQVSILSKIQNFRKNINLMEWEHAYLDMQKRNMEDHYTDLQLLRVTKNLQELITTGDASEKQKMEQGLLEAKLAYMGKNHHVHQLKQAKTTQALRSQLGDRLKENDQFKRQLQDLQTHIHIREDIVASRRASSVAATTGKGKKQPIKDNKLKAITVRRKLVDLAKAQSEEIEFMRQELDKIRRRTFPSFVQPMQAPNDDDDNDDNFG